MKQTKTTTKNQKQKEKKVEENQWHIKANCALMVNLPLMKYRQYTEVAICHLPQNPEVC